MSTLAGASSGHSAHRCGVRLSDRSQFVDVRGCVVSAIRRLVAGGSTRLAVGAGTLAVGPALAGLVAARAMGPSGRGELAVLLAVSSVAGTVGLHGCDTALLAGSGPSTSMAIGRRVISASSIEGVIGAIIAAAVLGGAGADRLGLVIANTGATTAFLLVRARNLSEHRSGVVLKSDLIASVVGLLGAFASAAADVGPEGYLGAASFGLLVAATVGMLRSDESGAVGPRPADGEQDTRGRRFAWAARSMQAAAFRADRVILAAIAGTSTAGAYVVAIPLAEMATIVPLHLAQLATVTIARSRTRARWHDLRFVRFALGGAIAWSVLVIALAPSILDVLYGSDFRSATSALRVLAVASVVSAIWRFAEAELFGLGIGRPAALATAVAACLVVLLTAALASAGPVSGAIASLVGYTAGLIVVERALRRARS